VVNQPQTLPMLLDERLQILAKIFKEEGTVEPELELLIKENALGLADKVDGIQTFFKMADLNAEALRAEAQELVEAARVMEGRAERLSDFLKLTMLAHGIKTLEGHRWSLNLQKTQGSLSLNEGVEILDKIPGRFVKVQTSVDIKAVKAEWVTLPEDLKSHFTMREGVSLIPRVRAKRKLNE